MIDAIIAAMERIRKHFDKVSRKQTLYSAIFYTVFSTYFLCWEVFYQIWKEARTGSHIWLYLDIFVSVLALLGIPASILMIHAVVRRLIAEARNLS